MSFPSQQAQAQASLTNNGTTLSFSGLLRVDEEDGSLVFNYNSPCEGCGETHAGGEFCRSCKRVSKALLRRVKLQDDKMVPYYVAAIGYSRHYGGPEEGGWWEDAVTVLEVRKCWNLRTGLARARELRAEHPTCPRGRGSVIGGTDVYIETFRTLEDLPEEGLPSGGWDWD